MSAEDHQVVEKQMTDTSHLLEQTVGVVCIALHDVPRQGQRLDETRAAEPEVVTLVAPGLEADCVAESFGDLVLCPHREEASWRCDAGWTAVDCLTFIIVAVLPVFLTVTRYNWDTVCGQQMGYLYRVVPVYVFGSVGVVLLNSVALMTELILKTVNSEGVTGDMRIVVFSSEFIFTLFLMVLMVFEPWIKPCLHSCQVSIRN
ncbi:CD2-associated -like protein [Labeo rohita]|uniref:CD2-associated-like protein n=1 Tax=Labeo rohita TaxID=84645 RepID=A0A498NZD9_LABRO|nr:CD2-associated -like protein [Labeo rohita]